MASDTQTEGTELRVAIVGGDDIMKEAVERELAWDPKLDAERVGVTANEGTIVLSGHVHAFSDRWAAVRAAERVAGVRAVADEIEVKFSQGSVRDDSDIAEDITRLLRLSTVIPVGVQAEVIDGHVTLRGECQWSYQRAEAERAVRFLAGVHRVSNTIMITPGPTTANVDERVAEAIERMADLNGRQIWVTASGGTVQLHGQVQSIAQRRMAEHVAAAAPGVADVKNELIVTRHQ